jgi:hypothetical protein
MWTNNFFLKIFKNTFIRSEKSSQKFGNSSVISKNAQRKQSPSGRKFAQAGHLAKTTQFFGGGGGG